MHISFRDNNIGFEGWQALASVISECNSLSSVNNFYRVQAVLSGRISELSFAETDAALGMIPFLLRSSKQLTSLDLRYRLPTETGSQTQFNTTQSLKLASDSGGFSSVMKRSLFFNPYILYNVTKILWLA